jgi:CRP/FNR family transcriptional regulator, anaerobic regulatory protein
MSFDNIRSRISETDDSFQCAVSIADGCATCSSSSLCWSAGIAVDEKRWYDNLKFTRRRIQRGDVLYHMGDRFESIYAVRSGFFKTRVLQEDGRDHVTSFRMNGELLGFDGIGSQTYTCDAIALEDGEICIIPYQRLMHLASKVQSLSLELNRMLSREIVREQQIMALLGTMQADKRVVTFLLNLSMRFNERQYSATHFILRMTREEIGNYLGLTLETVSRVLGRLQTAKLIGIENRKEITLLDVDRLKAVSRRESAPLQLTKNLAVPVVFRRQPFGLKLAHA